MYNHFAVTVTTARHSGMIGSGCLTETSYQNEVKTTLIATASTATSNVSSNCAYNVSSCAYRTTSNVQMDNI